MKSLRHISIAILLLSVSSTFAQQLPQFTQYMFNTISINPAYAGSRETLSVVGFLTYMQITPILLRQVKPPN